MRPGDLPGLAVARSDGVVTKSRWLQLHTIRCTPIVLSPLRTEALRTSSAKRISAARVQYGDHAAHAIIQGSFPGEDALTLERAHRLDGELRREPDEPERDAMPGEQPEPGRRTRVEMLEQAAAGTPRDGEANAPGRRTRVPEGSSPGLGLDGEAAAGELQAGAANAAPERGGEAASAQIAYYLELRRRSGSERTS